MEDLIRHDLSSREQGILSDADQFRQVDTWRSALGLLPMPLRATQNAQQQFALLNGSSGNFCLDFEGAVDRATRCAYAWSSDVGHYLTFVGDTVLVNRWDRPSLEEKYSARSVFSKLPDFHRHLERTSPSRSGNVVSHVLRIFRQIRSVVGDGNDGETSLKVLLHLLATAASGEGRFKLDPEQWGLASNTFVSSEAVSEATWTPLYLDLIGLGRYDTLRLDLELVLRHASGAVFQEAHLAAQLSQTAWFPGFEQPVGIIKPASQMLDGAHFTPPTLARTLAEETVRVLSSQEKLDSLVIFDPACGSGELLKECLRLLRSVGHVGSVKLIGWDKSPSSIDMARFILSWEARSWPVGKVQIQLSQEDSVLADKWPDEVDVVIMNPPFLSWQQMTPEEREAASARLGSRLRNKPNLAMVFALRALESLGDEGVLGMIAPASIMEGASGREVRAALANSLHPVLVARLGNQNIFAHALVDVGFYIGRKAARDATPPAVLWADSQQHSLSQALRALRRWRGAESVPVGEEGFSVYQRDQLATTSAPWVARSYRAWQFHQLLSRSKKTVPAAAIFDIKQGVRLGSDVFIVSKEYVRALPHPEQSYFRPALMNSSLRQGSLNDAHYVFYPYTSGLPKISTEEELSYCVPSYYKDALKPLKQTLSSRKSLQRANLSWWDLIWHRSWLEEPGPRLISKYFGSSRSFAYDLTGDYVVVVGYGWVLKRGMLKADITAEEVNFATLTYLSGTAADLLLQYASVQVSGGQWDLSSKFMENLPIPDLKAVKPAALNSLVEVGRLIATGSFENWHEIDELVVDALIG